MNPATIFLLETQTIEPVEKRRWAGGKAVVVVAIAAAINCGGECGGDCGGDCGGTMTCRDDCGGMG